MILTYIIIHHSHLLSCRAWCDRVFFKVLFEGVKWKNSLPFLDPQDASEGVKTFSEGVSLFSNQTPVFLFKCHHLGKSVHYAGWTSCIYFPASSWRTLFFSVCILFCTNVLSFHSLYIWLKLPQPQPLFLCSSMIVSQSSLLTYQKSQASTIIIFLLARWGSYHCKITCLNIVRNLSYIGNRLLQQKSMLEQMPGTNVDMACMMHGLQ